MIKTLKGAKETVKLMKATRQANKESKKNIKTIGIQLAKKNYKAKTGKEMTPSILKAELNSGFPSKATREYLKDKRTITKQKMKHYFK